MLNHHFIELIYNVVMSTHYLVGFGSRAVLSFYRYVSFKYYLIWSIYHLLLLIWHTILFIFYVIWLTLRSIGSKDHKTFIDPVENVVFSNHYSGRFIYSVVMSTVGLPYNFVLILL